MQVKIITRTPEEFAKVRSYLINNYNSRDNPLMTADNFKNATSHMWLILDVAKKQVLSWQTLSGYTETAYKAVLNRYFANSIQSDPIEVLTNPEDYPEYYI